MSRLAAVFFLLALACQGPERATAPPAQPRPAPPLPAPAPTSQGEPDGGPKASRTLVPGSWGLSPAPAVPLDSLLGQRRSAIEATFQARSAEDSDGWVTYDETWALRYEDDCSVELRCELPAGLDCEQAAVLTGYAGCPEMGRTEHGCIWASRYITAEFKPGEGTFLVRLQREARKCPAEAP